MTAETAMHMIHKRVMRHIAARTESSRSVDTADPDTLRRIDEETADDNESFVSDVEDIAVRWKESENRARKARKGKRK